MHMKRSLSLICIAFLPLGGGAGFSAAAAFPPAHYLKTIVASFNAQVPKMFELQSTKSTS